MSQDPSVVTWQIALAGSRRPSAGPRRHWWREFVTASWRDAYDQWLHHAEAASVGYATELAEFRAQHPAPTLKAFMVGLAAGSMAPEPRLGDEREVA